MSEDNKSANSQLTSDSPMHPRRWNNFDDIALNSIGRIPNSDGNEQRDPIFLSLPVLYYQIQKIQMY